MSLDRLVTEFADCVAAQTDAMDRGDSIAGNAFARRYVAAFEALRARGNPGRDALAILLNDSRSDVRVMAAVFLLRHCGHVARSILETEARQAGFVAFGASQALQRWDDGTWSLDPE